MALRKFNRRGFLSAAALSALCSGAVLRGQAAAALVIDVTHDPYNADPTGARNATDAFYAACRAIMAAGAGDLVIPPGTYRVGRQSPARGKDWAFEPAPIILLQGCRGPVNIYGRGARLIAEAGLKYGSFDRSTGRRLEPKLPFTDRSARASPYVAMVALYGNKGTVRVQGLELDGNIAAQAIGGRWNDTGIQINASGIEAYDNDHLIVEDVKSHHHPLDGMTIGYKGLTASSGTKPHVLSNCVFDSNGRQALSWVGGNSLQVRSCRFARTGRAGVTTPPGAGIDIEAENSICRNGVFEDCEFVDNASVGFLTHAPADNADIVCRRCKFVGTTSWSAWPANPGMRFENCVFVGAMTNAFGSTEAPLRAARFYDCRFTADKSLSQTGRVYRQNYLVAELDGPANVLFERCTFDSGGNTDAGLVFMSGAIRIRDCRFRQDGPQLAVIRGIFEGQNSIVTRGTVDFSGALFHGKVDVNGTAVGTLSPA